VVAEFITTVNILAAAVLAVIEHHHLQQLLEQYIQLL
jgi:cytochrome P450